jgi:N-hydroxyarylamine O-acetyltransferase
VSLSDRDLKAYFDRIGFAGDPRPDRETLAALVAAHTAAIPFENLNPLLGLPVELGSESLVAKLVRSHRGGYCFEQNGLFRLVLEKIGFVVTGLAARVLWMLPEDSITPRTHMTLLVELPAGPVLADVGFGGAVCTGVLNLMPDVPQETPHGRYRLVQSDGEWRQQAEIEGEWRTTYRFDFTPQPQVDYELANWWTSTSPLSHFTQGLTVARSPPGRRMTLRNFDFATHRLGVPSDRRRLESPGEVCAVLENEFGIGIPDRDALIVRLETLG